MMTTLQSTFFSYEALVHNVHVQSLETQKGIYRDYEEESVFSPFLFF